MDLHTVARNTKYPPDAFDFVQRGLDFTVRRIHGEPPVAQGEEEAAESRHVSGQQLCHGLRAFAIEQYGLMAQTVLERWRITCSDDFGRIVFAMINADMMRKTNHDRLEDFSDVFDFSDAFAPQAILSDNV